MRCPNCETENAEDARLCVECGFPLAGAVARGAGAASPSRAPSARERRRTSSDQAQVISAAPSADDADGSDELVPYHFEYASPAETAPPERERTPASRVGADERGVALPNEASEPLARLLRADEPRLRRETAAAQAARAVALSETSVVRPVENFFADSSPDVENIHDEQNGQKARNVRNEQKANVHDQVNLVVDAEDSFVDNTYAETPVDPFATIAVAPLADASAFDQASYQPESFQSELYPPETTTTDFSPEEPLEPAESLQTEQFAKAAQPLQPYEHTRPASRTSRGRNFRIAQEKQGMGAGQKALVTVGVVAVVAALIAVIGFALGLWGGVAIPNVVGMTQDAAEKVLRETGFETQAETVPSDEIEGRVVATNPPVGTLAEEGSAITMQIAAAREIPPVLGKAQDEAQSMFDAQGYTNVQVVYEHSNGQEGIVLAVSPEAGTRAKSGIEITLTVSQGYYVPDVSGKTSEEAASAIKDAGLEPTIMYIDTDQYPDGSVIGTDPAAGSKVNEGSYVAITVARLRGVELTNLAREYLATGNNVTIGGVNYQIEQVDALSYQGNETVAFTVQAKPFVEMFGETLFASSSQTVSGSIVYNASNEVIGVY